MGDETGCIRWKEKSIYTSNIILYNLEQEIMLFLVLQHEQEIQEQEKNTPMELIDEENGSISEEDRTWHVS